jgi:GNAT superfamily N-acetyltransferase
MTGHTPAIRPSTHADAELLSRLFAENKSGDFALLGLSQRLLRMLVESQYHVRCCSYAANFPTAEQFILVDHDADVGQMLVLQRENDLLLVDFAVAQASRNRGVGTAALEWLLMRASAAGQSVMLSVRADSPAARLYIRMGFQQIDHSDVDQTMRWTAPREIVHAA